MIRLIMCLILLSLSTIGKTETIVRFYFQQGIESKTIDLKLYDEDKSATVTNFMSYVSDGSYKDSFIHRRAATNINIMQGGGYRFDVNNTDFSTSYSKVPAKASVINEPGVSNLRGTIAMAKIAAIVLPDGTLKPGTGPDSATSEWFFNLGDNSSSLDLQNGGFTVFGEVINNGMSVLDSIAGLPLPLYGEPGAPFPEIPLVDYIVGDLVLTSNLVQVKKVEGLFEVSPDYIFNKPTTSASDEAVFYIKNISNQNLNVGSINMISGIETPFVITNNGCKNPSALPGEGTTLLPGDSCTFNVSFSNPEKQVVYSDDLNIDFPNLALSYTINVSGSFGIYGVTPKDIYRIGPDSNYDYGVVTPTSNLQPEFFIENISDQDLVIGDMGNLDPIEKPFNIKSARCINWVLAPGEKCTFILGFRPKLPGTFSSSFNIEFPELNLNHKINLTGAGGAPAYEPDIMVAFASRGLRSANFGKLDFSSNEILPEYTVDIAYQNLGAASLTITDVFLITSQPDEFSVGIDGDCLSKVTLTYLEACFQSITFTPGSIGKKEAILRIVSNDPDEDYFDYTVIANVLAENDGVDKLVEDAGPNGGDANYDGSPDSEQSNVVSLPDLSGRYVTYIGDPGVRYSNVKFTDRNSYPNIPDQVSMTTGVFEFTVENIQMNNRVKVGMILPASLNVNDFYVYGSTTTNSEPHWYKLTSDEEVGVVILSDGVLNTGDGPAVSGTFVMLYLKNGSRGDSTFDADNKLKVIGAFFEPSNESSGSLHLVVLLFILLTVLYLRNIKYHAIVVKR